MLVADEEGKESTYSSLHGLPGLRDGVRGTPAADVLVQQPVRRLRGVPRPRGQDGVRPRPHHPGQGPVHRGRCRRAVPQPDGRLPGPVPRDGRKELRLLGPHPHQRPDRGAVQRPDVRLSREDALLDEHEKRRRPVVAQRRVGRAPPADRPALCPDPVRVAEARTGELHAGLPLPGLQGKAAQGQGARGQDQREVDHRCDRSLGHGLPRVLLGSSSSPRKRRGSPGRSSRRSSPGSTSWKRSASGTSRSPGMPGRSRAGRRSGSGSPPRSART